MDDLITRIVDIEKQCSAEIETVKQEYEKKIETHKRFLGEKMTRERAEILSKENMRFAQALEEATRKTKSASAVFLREIEGLFQDQTLNEVIKEDILSILLKS